MSPPEFRFYYDFEHEFLARLQRPVGPIICSRAPLCNLIRVILANVGYLFIYLDLFTFFLFNRVY